MLLSTYLSPGSPELLQAHLKGLRDWNFHWLLGCTFTVGLGLLIELPEIVHDECEIWGKKSRELRYWLSPSIERKKYPKRDWVKHWSALGWVLIVLGVMGEGWFEAQVSKYDSALSNLTTAAVAEAQQKSAQAEAIAKGFDKQIAESNAKAASAEATAKGFEAQIADAQRDAATSEKEAESERLERTKLEAAVAPRSLSLEQQRQIRDVCRRFRGHNILVESYGIDGEAAALGTQIISLLQDGTGINVLDNRGRSFTAGGFDVGIHVRDPSGKDGDFASTLGEALSSIGKLNVHVNDPFPKTTGAFFGGGPAFPPGTVYVQLMIGVKPLPVLGNSRSRANNNTK